MSDSKHTPGPWGVRRLPDDSGVLVQQWGAPQHTIAYMPDMAAHGLAMANNRDNARLIAAAPTLLRALELVAASIDLDNDGFAPTETRTVQIQAGVINAVRAAIKKAEG